MLFITCVNNYVFIAVWDYLLVPYYVSFSTYALWDNYCSFLPLWFIAITLGNMTPLAVSALRNTLIVWAPLCYNANVRVTFCSSDFSHLLRLGNPKQKLWLAWCLPWPSCRLVSITLSLTKWRASLAHPPSSLWMEFSNRSTTSISPLNHNYSLNALDPYTVTWNARTIMYELEEKLDSICKICIWFHS